MLHRFTMTTSIPITPPPRGQGVPWLTLSAAVALAVFFFWHVWFDMAQVALRDETFGYALTIPPVVGFIAWRRLRQPWPAPRGRLVGVLLVALGLFMHGLALHYGGILLTYFWYGSVLVVLLGLCVAVLGVAVCRMLLSVFALLVLVVPIPPGVVSVVGHQLMYLSATVTADLLRLVGVPVEQFLYLLVVDGKPLNVGEACSGLRSFFALFGSTAVFCVACRLRWQVGLLLLGLTPIMAVLGNLTRLLPTALLYRFGSDEVAGAAHDLLGFVSVGLGLAFVAAVLATLRWAGVGLKAAKPTVTNDMSSVQMQTRRVSRPVDQWGALSCCAALIIAVGGAGSYFEWPSGQRGAYHEQVRRQVLASDLALPGWQREESPLDEWAASLLQPNAARRVRLTSSGGQQVHASLIHCCYQRDLAYHTPPSCYPSAGWNLQETRTLQVPQPGRTVGITQYAFARVSKDGIQRIYVCNVLAMPDGRTAADEADAFGSNIQQGRHDPWGAAQLTLVFPGQSSEEQRCSITAQLLTACWPTFETIMNGRPEQAPRLLATAVGDWQ